MRDSGDGAGRIAPWVLVAGGFHGQGGMDKANAAVARSLAERGVPVYLVAHRVDPELASLPPVTVSLVPRPLGSFALGEHLLDRTGRAMARKVTREHPGARVVVNGGNCHWPDVNWVHAVHHAWPPVDGRAPAWFRLKNRVTKRSARRRERQIVPSARIVVANSERTRSDLASRLGVDPARVRTLYLGADEGAGPASPSERRAARAWLDCPDDVPIVAFVGPLGRDWNKGFDTLWEAWRHLAVEPAWQTARLVAAGAGAGEWRARCAAAPWASRVRFVGFTDRIADVLAASDVLVSPARYEAYGLNVHEALCREVPVIVSRSAGITERFPSPLADMILDDPEDRGALVSTLRRWRAAPEAWRDRVRPFAASLRAYTWTDMAEGFVSLVEHPCPAPDGSSAA